MRLRARRDSNEAQIVDALEHTGWLVHRNFEGNGWPDLTALNIRTQRIVLVEVKQPKGGTLTPMQRVLKQKWPVIVLSTVDQAIELGRFSSGVGTG